MCPISFCIQLSFLILLLIYDSQQTVDPVEPRIAIIGAGISGTSAAYFLSKTTGLNPKIDIYSKDPVGGRMATINIHGFDFETGGSILHPRNRYMKQFAEEFGFKQKKGISGKFGLYDGSGFVYSEGDWSVLNVASLLWRYGFSLLKVNTLIGDMLNQFERIYNVQDDGYAFSNVADLLSAMDPSFNLMLERTLEEGLKRVGISSLFIDELANAIMRVNYGQSTDAHQFVGSVSLAGAETGLWSLRGGNKKIPQALLNTSRANFYYEEVEAIHLNTDGRFSLRFKQNDEMPSYDAVILATPVTNDTSSFGFENFPRQFHFPGRYHQTICTMVQGEVNHETFGFADASSVIDDIFTTNRTLFFNSLARNYPVDMDDGGGDAPSVWKVFSNEPLTKEELNILFSSINETYVIHWKAYPEYDGTISTGNFTLYPGLYHINAIEFAASAMEMSVIGARNVALLAASHLGVDIQDRRAQSFHIEL
ncbi:prenylcysteine oxidase [Daphnia magna]|uniref:Prenylcysteine oxidase 1 n=2 Tax=Daphnia magna TaxID=35525 RepID=A0A0N8A301_9CRUS|nr:prenylcysteine oxidase [Daphnia magna]KAK4020758.1 hypothetical protein OUZ56_002708 [Daphnia magna]KZS15509.1 Prenylcysteine oxidase 1 [Daphnia magna]